MVKKFKEWRDQLTWQQVKRIMWVVGIIVAICWLIPIVIISIRYNLDIGDCFILLTTIIGIVAGMVTAVWLLLYGSSKQLAFEYDELKKKISIQLKEDEFVEVYLKQERYHTNRLFLYVPDEPNVKHFARKQEETVYVLSKKSGEQIKNYTIENWRYFEYNFTFTKEEE